MRRVLGSLAGLAALLLVLALWLLPGLTAARMNPTVEADFGVPSAEAAALHATLMVADLHADVTLWDRTILEESSIGHVDLPRLLAGRVGLQAFTAVTKTPADMNIEANAGDTDQIRLLTIAQLWPPRTWSSLAERALHQADKLHRAAAASDGTLIVLRTREDLEAHLAAWRSGGGGPVAGFLGIEGAHALEGELANVDRLFDAGYRMFGLTHFFDNEVGGSAHGVERAGLTDFGHEVVARAEQLGIAIDLAHAAPALIDDVLAIATRPIIVSHTGVRGTCDNRRNLDDDRLRGIAATGGVIGVGLWETAVCGETPQAWAHAVRHAVDVGGIDHVGLGSDWDGAVRAIVDAAGTVHLTAALMEAGFAEDEIVKIMGGNVARVLGETLPARTGG